MEKFFFGLLDSDDHRPINSNIIFRSVVTTDVNNVTTDGNMDCDDMTKYVIWRDVTDVELWLKMEQGGQNIWFLLAPLHYIGHGYKHFLSRVDWYRMHKNFFAERVLK